MINHKEYKRIIEEYKAELLALQNQIKSDCIQKYAINLYSNNLVIRVEHNFSDKNTVNSPEIFLIDGENEFSFKLNLSIMDGKWIFEGN